jgi:cysteinyl-tRNA synthetase
MPGTNRPGHPGRTHGVTIRLYNTLTRQVEDFVPMDPPRVRMYTCGPTVYNYAHIGNLRAYAFEDLLRRHLEYRGYEVLHVMNLTDVDDKIIRGCREHQVPLAEFTRPFKDAFFEDLRTLAIRPAHHYPAATDHIPDMIALIQRLFERELAYQSDDGSVYFSITRFPDYGRLAHLDTAGLKPGARVDQDEYDKEFVGDFALWKAWTPADGEIGWESPWGRGRPGWHIECSAMSMKYLSESFDIHCGGVDNIFPHHEDEMAQSEGATGKPLARFWIHNAHLVVDGRKMAKSAGNFYALGDLLRHGYGGREIRYVLMAHAHYRQSLNFSLAALDAARASLARLDEFRGRVRDAAAAGRGWGRAGLVCGGVEPVRRSAGRGFECFQRLGGALRPGAGGKQGAGPGGAAGGGGGRGRRRPGGDGPGVRVPDPARGRRGPAHCRIARGAPGGPPVQGLGRLRPDSRRIGGLGLGGPGYPAGPETEEALTDGPGTLYFL